MVRYKNTELTSDLSFIPQIMEIMCGKTKVKILKIKSLQRQNDNLNQAYSLKLLSLMQNPQNPHHDC